MWSPTEADDTFYIQWNGGPMVTHTHAARQTSYRACPAGARGAA